MMLLVSHASSSESRENHVRDVAATSKSSESAITSTSAYRYTGTTYVPGSMSAINDHGSVCGFVTSDIRKSSILGHMSLDVG